MPRRLSYTEKALDDLDAARRKLAAIRADIRRLQKDPCQWPVGDMRGVRELPAAGGWRVLYEVDPDTGRSATAGDVRVLRLYGPGQDRRGFRSSPR